jgi:hypothetical protein
VHEPEDNSGEAGDEQETLGEDLGISRQALDALSARAHPAASHTNEEALAESEGVQPSGEGRRSSRRSGRAVGLREASEGGSALERATVRSTRLGASPEGDEKTLTGSGPRGIRRLRPKGYLGPTRVSPITAPPSRCCHGLPAGAEVGLVVHTGSP